MATKYHFDAYLSLLIKDIDIHFPHSVIYIYPFFVCQLLMGKPTYKSNLNAMDLCTDT